MKDPYFKAKFSTTLLDSTPLVFCRAADSTPLRHLQVRSLTGRLDLGFLFSFFQA